MVVPTAFKRIETFSPTVGCLLLFGRQREVAHGPGQLPCVFVLGPGIGRLHDSLLQQSGCRRCGGGGGKGEGWRAGRGGGWGAVRVAEQCQGEEEGQGGWWHCGSISGGTGLATIITIATVLIGRIERGPVEVAVKNEEIGQKCQKMNKKNTLTSVTVE